MLTSLEWQTLEQRRRISRLVMMYKTQHQLVDIDRVTAEPEVNIGSSGRGSIMTLRNSFQRTAREWNHLPDTTVGASSKEEFRANLEQQVSHANQCK
jgi:adenylosuccinate synthase